MARSFIGKLLNQGGPPVPYANRGPSRYARPATTSPLVAYKKMGTLNSTVSLLASSTARPEWRMYRKTTDNRRRYSTAGDQSDQRVEVLVHPALTALRKPNDFWTRFMLMEQVQQYVDLTGLGYLLLGYDARASFPIELWPVRPDRIAPVPSARSYLSGYIYTGPGGEEVPLDVRQVIPIRLPDPEDPFCGAGPVEPVLTDIESAHFAGQYNRQFFFNGAEPGGVIETPTRLDDTEWDEFQERWRESHQGVSRAHAVAMIEGGMKWVPNASTHRDMDFANLRNLARDIVRESFGMHKVMLGVTDDVNRANAQTGEEVFYSWKVIPRLDRWKMALNEFFLPLFGASGQGVELDYVAPKVTNREQDNAELTARSTAAQLLVQAGYDPADVLEACGLPSMAFGTAPEPPARTAPVPGDSAGSGAPPPDPDTGGQFGDLATILREQLTPLIRPVNGRNLAGVSQ